MKKYAVHDKLGDRRNDASEQAQEQVQLKPDPQFLDERPASLVQRKLQEKAAGSARLAQLHAAGQVANNTGLPDDLKAGIERLSGYAMDDVKVHFNSGKPARLQAHAYAQGSEIHLAPGQEKHLPHEAWHLVQQKQGRVAATAQLKGAVDINDDTGLESEADTMGAKALALGGNPDAEVDKQSLPLLSSVPSRATLQAVWVDVGGGPVWEDDAIFYSRYIPAYWKTMYFTPQGAEHPELIMVLKTQQELQMQAHQMYLQQMHMQQMHMQQMHMQQMRGAMPMFPPVQMPMQMPMPPMPIHMGPPLSTPMASTQVHEVKEQEPSSPANKTEMPVSIPKLSLSNSMPSSAPIAIPEKGASSAPLEPAVSSGVQYEPRALRGDRPRRVRNMAKGRGENKHVGHKIPNAFLAGFHDTCLTAALLPECPKKLRDSINRLPDIREFVYMDINLQFEDGDPGKSSHSKTEAEKLEFHGPNTPRSRILEPVHDKLSSAGELTFDEIQWALDEIEKAQKLGNKWSGDKK